MKVTRVSWLLAVILSTMTATRVQAQLLRELTPDQVKEAIEKGKDGCYELKKGVFGNRPRILGCYSTPYSRVVSAAKAAKKKYEAFDATQVNDDLVRPGELFVHAFAQNQLRGGGIVSVATVVIMPKGSKDRSQAIKPIRTLDTSDDYKNAFGAVFEGKSMTAVFPLDVLTEANEVHIVYEEDACQSGMGKTSADCDIDFKLKGVR